MGFFQRIRNAAARFMYGRNGGDQLGLTIIWGAVVLDIIGRAVKLPLVGAALSTLSTVGFFWAIFRLLSRNLAKRRAENAWFLQHVWYPVKRTFAAGKQRRCDKEHKYFTCPNCRTVCRVPRGKGHIVITCPKCRGEIRGKS